MRRWRVHIHSKLFRTALRSTFDNDLIQIYVERIIVDGLELSKLVNEFALQQRKLQLYTIALYSSIRLFNHLTWTTLQAL